MNRIDRLDQTLIDMHIRTMPLSRLLRIKLWHACVCAVLNCDGTLKPWTRVAPRFLDPFAKYAHKKGMEV